MSISPRLQGLLQRYSTQAAQAATPEAIKAQAMQQEKSMKDAGLMTPGNRYRQTVPAGGLDYLRNLRRAAATGKLPPAGQGPGGLTLPAGVGGGFRFGGSSEIAGGVTGGSGSRAGAFAGPITNSLPQSGDRTDSSGNRFFGRPRQTTAQALAEARSQGLSSVLTR